MNLVKITEVTEKFGISSRTLRYYEQVGLLKSERPHFEKHRFYDSENINRLQQILVLRKMQISIKDILRIYENQDMETLVQSFVKRMEEIDEEISTLSQLKAFVNDFLNAMTAHGITHISALPLLYEKAQTEPLPALKKGLSIEALNTITDKMARPLEMDIVTLPPMPVITSIRTDSRKSEIESFWDWLSANQIPFGKPGSRTIFEYQIGEDIVMMQKLPGQVADMEKRNESTEALPFEYREFAGGLFAVSSTYTDEDLGALQYRMLQSFDDNPSFEVDFLHNGGLRHEALIEAVFSPENNRERINIYVPVRQRKPNFVDYPEFEMTESISYEEIEKANPILRQYGVDFHKITPIYDPHFTVLENGEAEFIAWISERKLDTNVAVRLPFRVDMEFLAQEESEEYLWGTTEGSLWFSHGDCTYTMNAENYADKALKKHALSFQQPVLGNEFSYPGIGNIPHDRYNKLTWVVGEKHFAVILNGEVRFCAISFPYMVMDLHLQTPQTILIGTNGQGKKRLRSVKISQLKTSAKTNTTQGALKINVKQSNNTLPQMRQIIHPEYGQNYWFNGCASYVMECLDEQDFDYWFFAGLTGENFTQIYSKNGFRGCGVVDYRLSEKGNHHVIEEIFEECGYASTFVPLKQILSNREMYVQMLMAYIDKGIPVILNDYGNNPHNRVSWGVLVGYADYGKTLLYMGGDGTVPDSISVEDLLPKGYTEQDDHCHGWLFIGEKQESKDLAGVYRERILSLPQLLAYENENYCFGVKAFRAWADHIEKGYFEQITPEEFDNWGMHTVYVCCLATNSGCCKEFLDKALALDPNMTFINHIIDLYRKTAHYWNDDNGTDLEALGGGFNVTLEALQNISRRKKIADKLRAFADCMDEVSTVIEQFIAK
ncbi:MerR family transcriptional regulator [Paenibacillus brevis]|uniref:MerR family transcriptional regulator n=1 Tax=Paenibacillus brevis TaxID=2841508 RepID=A0ABS6FNE5_9BACL|nr:MerR family transcriptional regulator [Paenibacillus brevis]MBU5671553.1 MerR family transcriptional regulator [Paenibacillus brevis]